MTDNLYDDDLYDDNKYDVLFTNISDSNSWRNRYITLQAACWFNDGIDGRIQIQQS